MVTRRRVFRHVLINETCKKHGFDQWQPSVNLEVLAREFIHDK